MTGPTPRLALVLAAIGITATLVLPGTHRAQPAPTTASGIGWRVLGGQDRPFRLAFTEGERTLTVQSLGAGPPGPSRAFSYRRTDGAFHALTKLLSESRRGSGAVYRVATTEPGRTATVSVVRERRRLRVSFRLQPEDDINRVFIVLGARANEHFLGTGQRAQWVDLRGSVTPLKVFNECKSSIVVPFFLSSRGYGVRLATTSVGMIAFPGGSWRDHHCELGTSACAQELRLVWTTRICVKSPRLDFDVYAGTPEEIVRAHAAVVGRPALPPPSQFALIKWRDHVAGPNELFEDIAQLRKRGIPIGWILLDNPWEKGAWGTGCYGSLTFDVARLGDPKALIDRIHGLGVRFMLWLSPQVRRQDACEPFPYPPDQLVAGRSHFLVDLTKPQARASFVRRLGDILALGVDGIKTDRGDEVDLEPVRLHGGPGVELHNRIPVLYAEAVASVIRRYRKADFAQLNRAAFAGSQRFVHGTFGGDLSHTFPGLRQAVRMAQNAGLSGFPIWGIDIGGYTGDPEVTSEVFVRWAQFSALTPIFEVGGQGLTSQFWRLGDRTVALFRRAAVLHYELFPYLYELARRASRTGVPVIRPLGFHYPDDDGSWQAGQEFLVGTDLLAAPVTDGSREGNRLSQRPTPWPVYLPPGAWVDVFRGTPVRGPATLTRPTPMEHFPLYLREGAAMPFNLRAPDVWSSAWRVDDLDRPSRAGWLFAPGPRTTRAQARGAGSFFARPRGRAVEMRVRSSRREVQIAVLLDRPPCRVFIGGREVPRARSLAALRRAHAGWTFHRGAFGGVVLKLTRPSRSATVTLCA